MIKNLFFFILASTLQAKSQLLNYSAVQDFKEHKAFQKVCNFNSEKDYLNDQIELGEINNLNDLAIVERLVNSLKLETNFEIIKCKNFNNAVAFIYEDKRVIIYDEDFIKALVYNSTEYSKIGVIAHEIGHHLLGHTISSTLNIEESKKKELEADNLAGFLLKLYNSSENEAYKFIELIEHSISENSTHPDKSSRLDAVKNGYFNTNTNKFKDLAMKGAFLEVLMLSKTNKFKEALALIRNDEIKNPWTNDMALYLKAQVLMENGFLDEAYFTYLKVSPSKFKNDAFFHYNFANCLNYIGKYKEAREHYEISLSISPNQIDALGNLALLYRDNFEDPKTAILLLEKCIKINDKDAKVYDVLGVTYSSFLKDYNKGIYYSTLATNIEPHNLKFKKNNALNNLFNRNYKTCHQVFIDLCESYGDKGSCDILDYYKNEFSSY